jgi:uncharacterized Zn finger protein
MARWDDDYRTYFPRSTPRDVKGGIKAHTARGQFAQSWWGRRWIEVLESFQIGARLQRGRAYARRGQVIAIHIQPGLVTAEVQGSRPEPYGIRIEVERLTEEEWTRVGSAISARAVFAAKLLAGEMPAEIEDLFRSARASLFPERARDLKTECSCPDWSNPCKHIAAVYYLLAEEFDRDPFLIFRMRGMDRDRLLRGTAPAMQAELPPPPEPLPADPQQFWNTDLVSAEIYGEIAPPAVHAALARRLGSFPFWRAEVRFLHAMEQVYRRASAVAQSVLDANPYAASLEQSVN